MKHTIVIMHRIIKMLAVVGLLGSVSLFSVAAPTLAAPPQITGDCVNLFTPSFARVTLSAADQAVAQPGTLQIVNANTQAVNAQRVATGQANVICVQLTPNRIARAHLDRATLPTSDQFEWVGHLEDIPYSQMVLVGNQGTLVGYINTPARSYTLRYTSAGVYAFYAVNEVAFPNDGHLTIPPEGYEPPATSRAMLDDGSIIDVMVLYTTDAKNGAGGQTAIDTLVDMAVAQTNTAFQSSLVTTRYRLVYKGEVAYTEGGDSNADLNNLRTATNGFEGVPALRDQYGADLVHLITDRSQYCGLGYQLTGGDAGSSPTYAFALTVRGCAVDNMTFAHEGGHNMGAAHDRANQPGGGSYAYSFAYRYPTKYRTIMAYATGCANPCGKAPYFSNPAVSHQGLPTGVAEGDPNAANNALTFNNKAVKIAQYRDSIAPLPTCFTLTTNATNGSVKRNQNPTCNSATQYISGTLVSLTAVPSTTYAFSNWTGDVPGGASSSNPVNVVLGANLNVTANFERCYTLTTSVTGGSASITTNPPANCDNGARFRENTVVTLTANLNGDTTFVNWDGNLGDTNAQKTLTMDADKNAIATVAGCVSLSLLNDPSTAGSVARSVPSGGPAGNRCANVLQYRAGTTVALTPTAAISHTFLYWRGAVITTTESIALTLNRDENLTANFLSLVGSNDTITNARQIALRSLCLPTCAVYLPLVIRGGTARTPEAPSVTVPVQRTLQPTAVITQTQTQQVYDDIIDTSNATDDPNDPRLCSGGTGTATVWYQFTAPVIGTLEIDTNGSNYDTVIAIWEGSPNNPNMMCDDDAGSDHADSYMYLFVTGGKTYYIEIADALSPDEDITPPPTLRVQNYGGLLYVNIRFTPYEPYTFRP